MKSVLVGRGVGLLKRGRCLPRFSASTLAHVVRRLAKSHVFSPCHRRSLLPIGFLKGSHQYPAKSSSRSSEYSPLKRSSSLRKLSLSILILSYKSGLFFGTPLGVLSFIFISILSISILLSLFFREPPSLFFREPPSKFWSTPSLFFRGCEYAL